MSRRGRAALFALLAGGCGIGSAGIASSYRDRVDEQLGATRPVVTLARPLARGAELRGRRVLDRLEVREVPVRFLPPDVIASPAEVAGRRLAVAVPAGSYLLGSQLRTVAGRDRSPHLGGDLQPVEVTVSGAGSLDPARSGTRVDVVVAGEPVTGGRARVRVAARGVRLLAIAPASPQEGTTAGADGWSATLALTRSQALELIEAENFAREIRLIPAS
jgi:Flp pilus assembly protein CpaB